MAKDIITQHLNDVVNPTWNWNKRCKTQRDELMNAVMGLGGEAGEVVDIHKKIFFHKEKDRVEELKLELGDCYYYLAKIQDLYGFTTEEILAANKAKLYERYEIK